MRKINSILAEILGDFPKNFNVRFRDGRSIEWAEQPKFTLIFKDKRALIRLLLRVDAFIAGQAYIMGKIDIEGDIFEAIKLADYLASLKLNRRKKFRILLKLLSS